MSAILEITGGNRYHAKEVSVSALRPVNPMTLCPNGKVRAAITLMVMASNDNAFWEWVFDSSRQNDGKIIFYDPQNTMMKTVSFSQGFCIEYEEIFKEADQQQLQFIRLKIVSKSVSIAGATITNSWDAQLQN